MVFGNKPPLGIEHTHHSVPGINWRAVSALKIERVDQLASTDWSSPPSNDGWRWIAGGRLLQEQDDFNITTSQRLRAGQSQIGIEYDRSVYLQYDRARAFNEVLLLADNGYARAGRLVSP